MSENNYDWLTGRYPDRSSEGIAQEHNRQLQSLRSDVKSLASSQSPSSLDVHHSSNVEVYTNVVVNVDFDIEAIVGSVDRLTDVFANSLFHESMQRATQGLKLLHVGQWATAEKVFKEAYAKDPTNVLLLIGIGELAARTGNFDIAASLFDQAKSLSSKPLNLNCVALLMHDLADAATKRSDRKGAKEFVKLANLVAPHAR